MIRSAVVDGDVRAYKVACRTCGDHAVDIKVVMSKDSGKELVLGTCRSCEGLRCRYYRWRENGPPR